MKTIEISERIGIIEDSWNVQIEDLLYQMHWGENLMHKEIGGELGIPRPTVTRWFKELRIPTQSCQRFTDKNLTSWLYKTGKLEKKTRYEGPDRRIQRTKGGLNVDFFKTWSPEMAYVLGYFAADGGMFLNSGGSRYIQFVSTDYELLEKTRRLLGSYHKIAPKRQYIRNCKDTFLLQIGCKEIYNDLIGLGFMPNKDLRMSLPDIPNKYIRHFMRGYFDGDGCVCFGYYERKSRGNKRTFYLHTSFAGANLKFLRGISETLSVNTGMGSGCLAERKGAHLSYSKKDSIKLFDYMYKGVSQDKYLERKYNKFIKAFQAKGA